MATDQGRKFHLAVSAVFPVGTCMRQSLTIGHMGVPGVATATSPPPRNLSSMGTLCALFVPRPSPKLEFALGGICGGPRRCAVWGNSQPHAQGRSNANRNSLSRRFVQSPLAGSRPSCRGTIVVLDRFAGHRQLRLSNCASLDTRSRIRGHGWDASLQERQRGRGSYRCCTASGQRDQQEGDSGEVGTGSHFRDSWEPVPIPVPSTKYPEYEVPLNN